MNKDSLREMCEFLPQDGGVPLMFAYGSAVFPQSNCKPGNMLDLVVVVDNPGVWHTENLKRNGSHYSCLRIVGAKRLSEFQEANFGAKVLCNTMIKVKGQLLKYNVIQTTHLINDLLDWDTLYISGRLHKPVMVVQEQTNNSDLQAALAVNRKSALHCSLLSLPERFSWKQLFAKVVSISYSGDFRMYFGEDKKKIENIVDANLERFQVIYQPLLKDIQTVCIERKEITQDSGFHAVYYHMSLLPKRVLWGLQKDIYRTSGYSKDLEEITFALANSRNYATKIENVVHRIVFRSSVEQSLKNIATAGVYKSVFYSSRKLLKMFRGIVR